MGCVTRDRADPAETPTIMPFEPVARGAANGVTTNLQWLCKELCHRDKTMGQARTPGGMRNPRNRCRRTPPPTAFRDFFPFLELNQQVALRHASQK